MRGMVRRIQGWERRGRLTKVTLSGCGGGRTTMGDKANKQAIHEDGYHGSGQASVV